MKKLLFILFSFPLTQISGQTNLALDLKKEPIVRIRSGPYVGLQRGKYLNLELGYELQRKAVKLIKPVTHAAQAGFDYNVFQNKMGISVGYWQKRGRLNLTYGASLLYKTDFTYNRIGISPVLGYKLSWFHFQAGINLLTPSKEFKNVNLLYVSLRVILIKNRDYKWRKFKK